MPDCPQCRAQPTIVVPEHVRTIAALTATIAAREATIASLNDTLSQRNAKIADMQSEIDGLNLTVEGLAAEIALWESRWPKNTCPKCGYQPEELIEGVVK